VLLHGFDSSSLEFRRFHPLLSQVGDVYAVDLAGWGFTDCGFSGPDAERIALGPPQKRAHLRAFLQQVVGRPVTLVGTSLGGTVAIDYATNHPENLDRLVLIDAQVGCVGKERSRGAGAGGQTGAACRAVLFLQPLTNQPPQPGT
jgi:pimeloyl-ACP methyl ester carboxylesterase